MSLKHRAKALAQLDTSADTPKTPPSSTTRSTLHRQILTIGRASSWKPAPRYEAGSLLKYNDRVALMTPHYGGKTVALEAYVSSMSTVHEVRVDVVKPSDCPPQRYVNYVFQVRPFDAEETETGEPKVAFVQWMLWCFGGWASICTPSF